MGMDIIKQPLVIVDDTSNRNRLESIIQQSFADKLMISSHDSPAFLKDPHMVAQTPFYIVGVTPKEHNGREVIKTIRGINSTAEIIASVATSNGALKEHAIMAGANDTLDAPARELLVTTKVGNLLRNQEGTYIDRKLGIPNHNAYMAKINDYYSALLRWQQSVLRGETTDPFHNTLLMVDVDNFKKYNDAYGHDQGDVALRKIAETLRRSIRGTDYLARFGGEEKVIVLPNTDEQQSEAVIKHILYNIQQAKIGIAQGLDIDPTRIYSDGKNVHKATVSIGAATMRVTPDKAGDLSEITLFTTLQQEADRALYAAKAEGRNRAVHYDQKKHMDMPIK